MSHGQKFGGAERLGVHVSSVKLSVDLASFNLSQHDLLFFDVIEDHQEVFAFSVSRIVVGHYGNSTVVFHDDSG